MTITARKAHNQRRDEGRQKRGGGRVVGEGALAGADPMGDDFMARVVGDEPTPEFAAMVADEYRRLFGSLADESLRVVALLKLEGHSNEEVARSLDCGLRTVERKLDVIRKALDGGEHSMNENGAGPSSSDSLLATRAEELDRVCDRFEAEWRSGGPPDLAAYLARTEGGERAVLRVN